MKRPILVLLAGTLLNLGAGAGAPAHAATTESVGTSPATVVTPAHDRDGDWYHHRYRDRDWHHRGHDRDWYHRDHDGDRDDYHDRYRDRDDHDRDGYHNGRQHCGGGLIVVCLL